MKFISNSNDVSEFLGIKIIKNIPIKDISTDTRTLKKKSLFIAIKGNNFDGNDHIDTAIKKGASIVITDKKIYKNSNDKRIVYVPNSINALKKISKNIINSFQGKIVGITGSNGKTSTTSIISQCIKGSSSTIKNFNNEIGMPLSIMNANRTSNTLVIEMGAAKPGDIHYLSSFLKPHIGVITNIGNSHLANLKNINGVFKVKSEIVNNIKKDGCLVIPSENGKHESQWKKMRNDISIITFGLDKDADFRASNIKYKTNSSAFTILSDKYCVEQKVNINLAGEHNIKNILAAYAVLFFLNKPEKSIVKNISNVKLTGRQNQSNWINRSTLIDDTYNANPDSVKKSVDLLSHSKKRKILVLGDMLELGRMRKQMHKDIGKYALKKKIDIFVGFGDLAKYAVDEFGKNGIFFNNEGELKIFLKKNVSKGDIVLIKGSRGMQMEKFINV
jgi:UDP-N-acetylmuramoyl-tripeptide--D-alanyl-D-alanine ligase